MPETFSPLQWINDTSPAINAPNLNRLEQGVEVLDDRIATLELGVVTPVVVPYATSVTLNATQGALFRCVASGDLTLDDIVGGTDGQMIVFEVQASGAQRTLHFTGSTDSIDIAVGQWWIGVFRYAAAGDTWRLVDNSGGGGASSGGSGSDLNILAPHEVTYAGTVTLDAATGALFRITAVGDLTLAAPINGTDGQAVVIEIEASGGTRIVSFAGGSAPAVTIPSGSVWTGTMRYNAGDDAWLLASSSGGSGSGGGGVPPDGSVTNASVATNAGISLDKTADGARLAMTAAERTKLAGVATGATANSSDATLLARANHTGTQSADTIVDGTTNKAYTAAEKTKLAGVATGATANATDAQLRDRSTHTGQQTAATISDFTEATQDAAAALFTTGTHTGISFAYDDTNAKVNATVTGGGSGYATVQDEGSALTARTALNFTGAGVTVTDDAANSRTLVTIPSGGGSGNTLTVYSVKTDYSAAGNGSTNDATAIQNALTAAGAAGGGIVYLPPGTYLVNKYLLIPSNVTLLGAGMGISIIKSGGSALRTSGGVAPDGGGYSILQATGVTRTNITIQDLTVDGNESADRTALAASGVRLNSYLVDMRTVSGLRILRVATRNTWTYNMVPFNCDGFEIAYCDVKDPGTTGVYNQLDGIHCLGSSRGRIHHNKVDNRTGGDADDAIAVHVIPGSNAITDVRVHHNVLRGGANGHGIQVAGDTVAISHVTLSDNDIYDCPAGIEAQWFSASGGAAIRHLTIRGNNVRDLTSARPIDCYADPAKGGHFEHLKIIGNTADGYGSAGSTASPGICVSGSNSTRGVVIADNIVSKGYSVGIELEQDQPVRDYVIANNHVDMSAASIAPIGMKIASGLDGTITGNTVLGRGTTDGQGIRLTGSSGNPQTNTIVSANRVRAFNTGVQVTNSGGANPTNTIATSNITQGCTTGISVGTATVTQANNL
jgi:polygalacturonase